MKLKDGRITILVDQDKIAIELYDGSSSITFAEIILTPKQFSSALSRLAFTECSINVNGVEKLNKQMETKNITFEAPRNNMGSSDAKELQKFAQEILNNDFKEEGWIAERYFGSQNSFYYVAGKRYVNCICRRWV